MTLLVTDCPRCSAKTITFDAISAIYLHSEYNWQHWFEVFCACRRCKRSTVFVVSTNDFSDKAIDLSKMSLSTLHMTLNDQFRIEGYINQANFLAAPPPESLPKDIEGAFREGATCLAVGCYNAAGTMFRLCVDLVTRPMLRSRDDATVPQPNGKQRRDLGLRLQWLFDNGLLPEGLRELAKAVREDANDGAHAGSLKKDDAEDLIDFTFALLDRLISEPERLKQAEERRHLRRSPASQ